MASYPSPSRRRHPGAGLPLLALLALLPGLILAFPHPASSGPWPSSSKNPVPTLDHPTLEEHLAATGPVPEDGFRFIAFGDQRALAGGEWERMMEQIARLAGIDPSILFMIDTGDIVENGEHSDQFVMLSEVLSPADRLPYLVGLGNHEVDNNRSPEARENAARFFSPLDPGLEPDRMYYRKDVGNVRFLFLDTNDLAYGEDGESEPNTAPRGSRTEAQLNWLEEQLEEPEAERGLTVVSLHHPFLQSSSKHRGIARRLWSFRHQGRTLPRILLEGGVDLVLCGHTHTYERFRLESGRNEMALVNLSGRPKGWFLFLGKGSRKPKDIQGKEIEFFEKKGWEDLEGWSFVQEEAMLSEEANQFGVFTVTPQGGIQLEVLYLDEKEPDGLRRSPRVPLIPK